MTVIIDGRKHAKTLLNQVAEAVSARVDAGLHRPGLAVVLVGENPRFPSVRST